METIVATFIAVLLDGIAGLSGGLLPHAFVHKHMASLLAFAAGTLLGAAFLDLLPEALKSGLFDPHHIMLAGMAGFFAFHLIQSVLGGHAAGQSGHKHSPIGPMILVGDAIHNVADGVAIAVAFVADLKAGLVASLAVVVHELPQEIGDYAILVAHGYSRPRALFWLVLVQLSALLGAAGTLWATHAMQWAIPLVMAASAGGFVYIAAADLLPELQRRRTGSALPKLLAFSGGLGCIAILESVVRI